VSGDGRQQNEPESSRRADDSESDVVEQGGRDFPLLNWRPSRGAAILLAVGLVVGLAGGYAAWYRQAPRNVSPPAASSGSASAAPGAALATGSAVPYLGGPALTQDTGTCAVQSGRGLELGIQVTNGSAAVIKLDQVHTVLPLGGLRAISQQWAPCGAIGVDQDPALSDAPGRFRSSSSSTTARPGSPPRSACPASMTWATCLIPAALGARQQ
jgi:hypothetical protein